MTQDCDTRQREARASHGRRRCVAWLMLILGACAPAWASEDLTVLVMPIERRETSGRPTFTPDSHPFKNLVFENPDADWKALKIGDHHWLCGELDAFARSIDAKVHVRFAHWNEALHSIVALRDRYDVVQVPSTWTAYLIEKKVLAKWDGLDTSQYHPQVLRSCSIEGKKDVYAVPWQIDLRVLFYRDELTDDPGKLVTYDGFVECLRTARERAKGEPSSTVVEPFGVGADRDWDILHNLFAYYTSGRLFEKRDGRWWPAFHVGDQRDGLKKFWRLRQEGLVCYSTREPAGDERIAYRLAESLADGECLAVFGGPHMRWTFAKHPDIHAVPLPQLHPPQNYSFLGGCHLAVSAAANGRGNDRNARALVRWLTREDAQRALAQKTDALPANKEALNEFFDQNPRWIAFRQALEHGVAYPSIPPWAEFESQKVRDDFDILRRQLERGADWDTTIAPQLNAIAEWLQPPDDGGVDDGPSHWWWIAALAIAAVGAIAWLWHARGSRRRWNRMIEKVGPVAAQLDALKQELLAGLAKHDQAAQEALSEALPVLASIPNVLQEVLAGQQRSDTSIKTLRSDLWGQYQKLTETLEGMLDADQPGIGDLLRSIQTYGEKVLDAIAALAPQQAPKLSECHLWAEFGWESNRVRLTMTIEHAGQTLGQHSWKGRAGERSARLLELVEIQRVTQTHSAAYTDMSFFLLTHQDRSHLGLPDSPGTPRKFVSGFRKELRGFLASHCAIDLPDQQKLLFEHQPGPPQTYVYVLAEQVKQHLRSNLEDAYASWERLRGQPGLTQMQVAPEIAKCPRCWPLWDLLRHCPDVGQADAELRSLGHSILD